MFFGVSIYLKKGPVIGQWHTHSPEIDPYQVTGRLFSLKTSQCKYNHSGPGEPIFSVGQSKMFKRLVHRTTMIFCPSDSIYLKANAFLGMGLTIIQSQPCLPAWHAWCLYHVYWSKTRLKLVSTENNIKNQFETCVNKGTLWQKDVNICGWGWLKCLSDMCQSPSKRGDAFGDIILLKSEKWWAT